MMCDTGMEVRLGWTGRDLGVLGTHCGVVSVSGLSGEMEEECTKWENEGRDERMMG